MFVKFFMVLGMSAAPTANKHLFASIWLEDYIQYCEM